MLSRLAESSFWMGRYLERAEGISRLLIEFHQLLIRDERAHVSRGCSLLTHVFGLEESANSAKELAKVVFGKPQNPSTVLGALHGARSNAQSIRDILPSDFYEAINGFGPATLNLNLEAPGSSLKLILDRLAVANGIYEWLSPEDEPSAFFELGRSLERLDLLSRLLALQLENEWRQEGAATTLRSIGGLSTFLKSRQPITAEAVRTFVVEDSGFPRSIYSCAQRAEIAIVKIGKFAKISTYDAISPLGQLSNEILFLGKDAPKRESLILQIPRIVNETSEGVRTSFFRDLNFVAWSK